MLHSTKVVVDGCDLQGFVIGADMRSSSVPSVVNVVRFAAGHRHRWEDGGGVLMACMAAVV